MFIYFLFFSVGLGILVYSSQWLIQGSVKLAFLFNLSPLFIGLVLVAFGTSAPEASVGIVASLAGKDAVALGNVVGSNIANIGLGISFCALFIAIKVEKSVLKLEVPVLLFSAVLLYIFSLDYVISRSEGSCFLLIFIAFMFFSYKQARLTFNQQEVSNFSFKGIFNKTSSKFLIILITIFSLIGLILGAKLMVENGVKMAKTMGVSDWIISVTVFAIGTSLPEFVASLAAMFKKIPNIAVGNIVGSNIFNILFILGIVSLIRPIKIPVNVMSFEYPILLAFSFIFFTVMRTGYTITRKEGFFLLSGYLTFLYFLIHK
ncbi:MAG: calcium/sodium antiporter [Candidatus Omnitrophica bacterium]|nr:calcium/sodium antiporter [Candidatus Omnitrophota bacterium]